MIFVVFLLLLSSSVFSLSKDAEELVVQANICAEINAPLSRLTCFDQLFSEKVARVQMQIDNDQANMPNAWKMAVRNEQERAKETGLVSYQLSNANGAKEVWLSSIGRSVFYFKPKIPSNNKMSHPLLLLSCVEKITRVEIILPRPVETNNVNVTLLGRKQIKTSWSIDDSGYILRMSRGQSSIALIKQLLNSTSVTLTSNIPALDTLNFDINNLPQQVVPLRLACGW